jgi:hypothetical protein
MDVMWPDVWREESGQVSYGVRHISVLRSHATSKVLTKEKDKEVRERVNARAASCITANSGHLRFQRNPKPQTPHPTPQTPSPDAYTN